MQNHLRVDSHVHFHSYVADGETSSKGSSECTACPHGKYQTGNTTCSVCALGETSQAGSDSCEKCPPGKYANSPPSSCLECPCKLYGMSIVDEKSVTCTFLRCVWQMGKRAMRAQALALPVLPDNIAVGTRHAHFVHPVRSPRRGQSFVKNALEEGMRIRLRLFAWPAQVGYIVLPVPYRVHTELCLSDGETSGEGSSMCTPYVSEGTEVGTQRVQFMDLMEAIN